MADQSTDSNRKTRVYHPYQDLQVPIQNLYNLPTSPEYLFDEESLHQRRSWSENLQYYTGSGYLSGAIIGGAKGSIEGIRAAEAGDTLKLRVNRVLNSGGQTGRSVFAGLGTGALYRAAAGPRSAVIAGAIGGLAAGAAVAGFEEEIWSKKAGCGTPSKRRKKKLVSSSRFKRELRRLGCSVSHGGLNDGEKRKLIKSMVRTEKADLVWFRETMVQEMSLKVVKAWVSAGGILIFWDNKVLDLLELSVEGSPYLVVLGMLEMVLYGCSQESMVQSY
ncbi:hypothetical protein AAG906_017232 [Vitis piasezkii]